ncbi:MAG: efflux RND transporter periplasmic adaptor subunit [Desulfobacteraceae bacterium]|jgi:RND family efflux transporter MFP subunit
MKSVTSQRVLLAVILAAVALLGWMVIATWLDRSGPHDPPGTLRPAPVEVAPIERGPIALRRTFSGELEALAEFVVAPKVSGRVERVLVNIADAVRRGQVVAELDNDEYVQAVAQARADLAVARANRSAAGSVLEIADREFQRTESLRKRGIASDSELDAARQDLLAKRAQLAVAEAQVAKFAAALESANIRLGYTRVTAGWTGGNDERVVAERYVDEGQTLAANTPLLLIVELDPILGIVFVTERDYANMQTGQLVSLTTAAYPDETFTGRIVRIAPVFRTATRQARIEMTVDNPRQRLKPGMFIQATVELSRVADAVIVPEQALTERNDRTGVFVVSEDGRSVRWREVAAGIRADGRVQVDGQGLSGRVVVIGQQQVDDGSPITIAADQEPRVPARNGAEPQ